MKTDTGMSVICHRDYCHNNLLYKYDYDGRPASMKIFDLAMVRLTSPAIDISFFLCLSTTSELRRQHWNDFLSTYPEMLRTTVPGVAVPTMEDVQEEIWK